MTVLLAANLGAQERFEFKELHMGMEVRIVLYAADEARARSAARAAFDRIEALENIMSDFRPESEARNLERRSGEWVGVSGELYYVLAVAIKVAATTGGAFDPTVAPLVQLWREARRTRQLPDQRSLDSARALVNWRRVEVHDFERRVRLAPGTRLDLGGIAKGAILHDVIRLLSERRFPALVEAGGDIALGDAPPGEKGWKIAIGDSTVVLTNRTVSTSGPQYQFVDIAGKRYSHVIDPRTGMALTNGFTATVVYGVGATADALATALAVLGPEGVSLVRQRFPDATASVRRD